MIKRFVLFVCLLGIAGLHQVQATGSTSGYVGIKTYDGILLVWNNPGNYFSLEFKGTAIRGKGAKEGGLYLAVDKALFQIQTAPIKNFLPAGPGSISDNTILQKHMQWESKYIQKFFKKEKLKIKIHGIQKIHGKIYFGWEYSLPAYFYKNRATPLGQRVKKQIFLTTRNRAHIIILNGTVTGSDDENEIYQYMVKTMQTLKTSPRPFDIEALQAKYRKPEKKGR